MKDAKLYKVCGEWHDGGEYVEAASFGEAIKKWLKHVNSKEYRAEEDEGFTRSKIKEPQSVELVTVRDVIR